jgi:tetratricopeptide (TPR) repeat protein
MSGKAAAATALAALLLLTAADARAQVGRVAGTVTDESGRGVQGATITAENRDQAPSTITSTTDARGRFSVIGLRRGPWVFTIRAPGFESVHARVDVLTDRPNPPLPVALTRTFGATAAGPLSGVDVPEVRRRIDAAAALAAAGDNAAAIAAYREIVRRVPALTSVHLEIGALYERMNDPAAALDAYRALVALEPDHVKAKAAIARLAGS